MGSRSLRRTLSTLLALSALLVGVPEARALDDGEFSLRPDVTWVGRFRYNPRRETVLLPLTGLLPSFSWGNTPRTLRFKVAYLDLPGLGAASAHLRSGPQRRFPEDRLVQLIMVSEPKPGLVRLVVRGSRPVHLVPHLVPYRGGWAVQVKVRPATQPKRR